ncbi:NAD-dependent epimerase/dehydratase family protein [bacterium]|nr:NAD-dependent epimerase/dehydratase family protein [bacterium]
MHSDNELSTKIIENNVLSYFEKYPLNSEIQSYYLGKQILVTGGAGAIGSNLIVALSNLVGTNGHIYVLDNLSAIKFPEPFNVRSADNLSFINGDIRDENQLKRIFANPIQIVFHLAAFFANQNSVDYPEHSIDVDIIGINKLLQFSSMTQVERFIYASSGCAIYGSYPKLPLSEDYISMHLTTPYQINKMTGEMYCNYYFHHFGLPTVNCRFFNSYGPGEVPGQYRNVIPNFLYWGMKGDALPITGDGNETRDFTFVVDLVQGLIKAGFNEKAIGENFNLAAGREIKIKDMAELVLQATGSKSGIEYRERRKWDTKPRLLASIDKAQNLIEYRPQISFEEGMTANVEWFRSQWDNIERLSDFKPGRSSALTSSNGDKK